MSRLRPAADRSRSQGSHAAPDREVDGAANSAPGDHDQAGPNLSGADGGVRASDVESGPDIGRSDRGHRTFEVVGRFNRGRAASGKVMRLIKGGSAMKRMLTVLFALGILSGAVLLLGGCGATGGGSAAQKTYVKPGEHDTHYAFLSGGHSGQVFVYGLPSCRYITTIPVFTPEPAKGYGIDEESKAMLKGFSWGDAHHPGLSETDGDYDGRWLFINDMPNARIARIDLADFTTREIFGPIPNLSAAHACPFPTQNTEYVFAASRFSMPVPTSKVTTVADYQKTFNGIIAGVK